MPEGHTLRQLADDLAAAFAGRTVRVSSPQGRFAADAEQLDGARLLGADSAGKHLFVELEGERFVHVHLGLIGTFAVHTAGRGGARPGRAGAPAPGRRGAGRAGVRRPARRDRVRPGRRRTGARRSWAGSAPTRCVPTPTPTWPGAASRAAARAIGDLLMDQKVLAGVGNVYRAEVLFRHRIHPLRPGSTLRVGQWRAMWEDLVELMAEGVRTGRIDTVRPEHTPEAMGRAPRRDDHGGEVYVYRRTVDAVPGLRLGGPHRRARRTQLLLVSEMSAHLPLARRTVRGQGHCDVARSTTVTSAREHLPGPDLRQRAGGVVNRVVPRGSRILVLLVVVAAALGARDLALPRLRPAGQPAGPARARPASCSGRASCRGSSSSCSSCSPWW